MVIVLTDKPLRKAMSSPEAIGWMVLWAIELSEFNIKYRPRTAMKGQVVTNFIVLIFSNMDSNNITKDTKATKVHFTYRF